MPVTSIELKFADGDYLFALPIPQILELERACGWADAGGNKRKTGIFTIYGRVLKGRYVLSDSDVAFGVPQDCDAHLNDVLETVRLALIGGGQGLVNGEEVQINALRARQLVETYCYPAAPLKETWDLAAAILVVVIEGYEGQKKSPVRAEKPPKASTKRKSSPIAR